MAAAGRIATIVPVHLRVRPKMGEIVHGDGGVSSATPIVLDRSTTPARHLQRSEVIVADAARAALDKDRKAWAWVGPIPNECSMLPILTTTANSVWMSSAK